MNRALVLAVGLFLLGPGADARAACEGSNDQVFVLGSSLSWDAQPQHLDHNPVWHIFCGRPLFFIFENPYGHCNGSSTPWPEVLETRASRPAEAYDFITFQPIGVDGSTQQQDIDTITHWLIGQPSCTTGIIHANWPAPGPWETRIHETDPDPDHTLTGWSLEYYHDLKEKLQMAHPGREFVLTRSNEMLDHIFHDTDAPVSFLEMFRDTYGHASYGPGRYLHHNAFRQAMRQTTGIDATAPGVDPTVKAYLDKVIALYPPRPLVPSLGRPALGVLAAVLAGAGAGILWRRWSARAGKCPKETPATSSRFA